MSEAATGELTRPEAEVEVASREYQFGIEDFEFGELAYPSIDDGLVLSVEKLSRHPYQTFWKRTMNGLIERFGYRPRDGDPSASAFRVPKIDWEIMQWNYQRVRGLSGIIKSEDNITTPRPGTVIEFLQRAGPQNAMVGAADVLHRGAQILLEDPEDHNGRNAMIAGTCFVDIARTQPAREQSETLRTAQNIFEELSSDESVSWVDQVKRMSARYAVDVQIKQALVSEVQPWQARERVAAAQLTAVNNLIAFIEDPRLHEMDPEDIFSVVSQESYITLGTDRELDKWEPLNEGDKDKFTFYSLALLPRQEAGSLFVPIDAEISDRHQRLLEGASPNMIGLRRKFNCDVVAERGDEISFTNIKGSARSLNSRARYSPLINIHHIHDIEVHNRCTTRYVGLDRDEYLDLNLRAAYALRAKYSGQELTAEASNSLDVLRGITFATKRINDAIEAGFDVPRRVAA